MLKKLHSGTSASWLKRLTSTVCTELFLIRAVDSLTNVLDNRQHLLVVVLRNTWMLILTNSSQANMIMSGKLSSTEILTLAIFRPGPRLRMKLKKDAWRGVKRLVLRCMTALLTKSTTVSLDLWSRHFTAQEIWARLSNVVVKP